MGEVSTNIPGTQFEAVRKVARACAVDRYLSALLAPRAARGDLIALAAFAGEIERVPLLVSEPALGEIRLRWWLDWLESLEAGASTGNPVADVFAGVVVRRELPRALIGGVIEARGEELYGAPFETEADYYDFLARTEVALFQLAARILAPTPKESPEAVERTGSSEAAKNPLVSYGRAYGGVRQLLRLPLLIRRGRWGLPTRTASFDIGALADPGVRAQANRLRADAINGVARSLQAARGCAKELERGGPTACLSAALVAPYVKALERQDDWLVAEAEISPLSRVWHLWRSHLSCRI